MNKTIIMLVVTGVGVVLLHMPNMFLSFGAIALVEIVTIKLVWRILQIFSRRPQAPDCHPSTHGK